MGHSQRRKNTTGTKDTGDSTKADRRDVALVHLSVRAFYNSIGWFVIGMDITSTFFVSLFLFVVPILMDSYYYGFAGWSRDKVVKSEIVVCLLWTLVAFLGLAGILAVKDDTVIVASNFVVLQGLSFPVHYLWIALGSIPIITWMDFGCRYSVKSDLNK